MIRNNPGNARVCPDLQAPMLVPKLLLGKKKLAWVCINLEQMGVTMFVDSLEMFVGYAGSCCNIH